MIFPIRMWATLVSLPVSQIFPLCPVPILTFTTNPINLLDLNRFFPNKIMLKPCWHTFFPVIFQKFFGTSLKHLKKTQRFHGFFPTDHPTDHPSQSEARVARAKAAIERSVRSVGSTKARCHWLPPEDAGWFSHGKMVVLPWEYHGKTDQNGGFCPEVVIWLWN